MAQSFGAKLALVSVEEHIPRFAGTVGEVEEEKEHLNGYFRTIQREAKKAAESRGMVFERADILTGHVSQNIINHAKAIQCDLIVMGHSGRSGVWGSFLGTTAEKVSRYAHCTVVIVR
jgi:nucleotide-binding universal stress UspA family protein